MNNEIVKIAINKGILENLERLAASRQVSMDSQFAHAFALLLGLYSLNRKERVEVMELIAIGFLDNPRGQ